MIAKFEIAPAEYWLQDVNLNVAMMHCLFLEVNNVKGWTLPTDAESEHLISLVDNEDQSDIPNFKVFENYWLSWDKGNGFWTKDDIDKDFASSQKWDVIPIRYL